MTRPRSTNFRLKCNDDDALVDDDGDEYRDELDTVGFADDGVVVVGLDRLRYDGVVASAVTSLLMVVLVKRDF